MPIYEYLCDACEERVEILQQISEPPLRECPVCHKATLKKLVSAAGFRLAGQGWYETDFKTKNQRNLVTTQEPKPDTAKGKDAKKANTVSSGDVNSKKSTATKSDKPKQQSNKAPKP
ncbi:MAG: zinc ribbon domain-containing protein [Chromatiales bacterium]|nr:zinc ribbon domain-containing protein [Chromatiales bacterium]